MTRQMKTPAEFIGGPRNLMTRHPLARNDGSTLLVFDFERADCNANEIGPLQIGDVFDNLAGPLDGVVGQTGTAPLAITSAADRLVAGTWVSGNLQRIDIGSAGGFNLTAANPNFHGHIVFATPDNAGSTAIQYNPIWACGTTANNLFLLDGGVNGRTPRVFCAAIAGSPVAQNITGFTLGAWNIVSFTRVGTLLQVWLNGVEVGQRTTNATLPDLSAVAMSLMGGRTGESIRSVMFETIPPSRTAAQVVADAYAISAA